ncbi:cell division protein FtsQ/DivIB [Furfurilactobacillus entadae]|uniref:cell division protein FtsQ/DivIB n=1 Tax=Furfurilactobacillus entadae TaxID=2922307 RepID=UPI0038B2E9A6
MAIANRIGSQTVPPKKRARLFRSGRGARTTPKIKPINATPPKPPHSDVVNRHRRHLVGGVFAGLLLLVGLMGSPLLMVHSVTANHTKTLTSKQIIQASGVKSGQPLWTIWRHDRQLEATATKNNDLIQHLSVKIQNGWTVQLTAKEYRQAGYLMQNNKYYVVIENGRILKTAQDHPVAGSGYPVYGGFKSDDTFATVIKQYAGLSADVKRGISQIDLSPTKENPDRLHLFMNDGNEVYATADTFGAKMKYYPEIAASMNKKGVINLEVGAYSHPFKAAKSSTSQTSSSSSEKSPTTASSNVAQSQVTTQ